MKTTTLPFIQKLQEQFSRVSTFTKEGVLKDSSNLRNTARDVVFAPVTANLKNILEGLEGRFISTLENPHTVLAMLSMDNITHLRPNTEDPKGDSTAQEFYQHQAKARIEYQDLLINLKTCFYSSGYVMKGYEPEDDDTKIEELFDKLIEKFENKA